MRSIIGVSRDSVASHEKFRDKQALPFALVADTDEVWCNAFDVIHEKMPCTDASSLGVVRSTFLIDAARTPDRGMARRAGARSCECGTGEPDLQVTVIDI